jgi:hypothetical protein
MQVWPRPRSAKADRQASDGKRQTASAGRQAPDGKRRTAEVAADPADPADPADDGLGVQTWP